MPPPQPAPIYLDHNATTPLLPEVAEAIRACWAQPLLNPGSQHEFGRRARRVLDDARERIAELLGAKIAGTDADRVIFTSGGTESNNLAIRGLLHPIMASAPASVTPSHLIVSAVEHPSIRSLADELKREGQKVELLAVDEAGVIRVEELEPMLQSNTAVVAAMLGQNETGVLQPVAKLAEVCERHSVPLHTDAAQVVGKLPVNFRALGAATMTVAAHKFNGPVGIGALIVRSGIDLAPQLFGGVQQGELRPGTEPVALVVGLLRALELSNDTQHERTAHLRALRDRFERAILAGWPAAIIVGARADRLPHTSNVAFVGLDRQALFIALDQAGVACSTGSACASGSSEPSPALSSMGLDSRVISSALRFSFGITSTRAEVDEAAERIIRICNDLGRQKPH